MPERHGSGFHVCLCLALLYLSWGGSFLGVKLMLTGFPPVFQNGIRLCGAGTLMLVLLPFTRHGRPSGIMEIVHYAVLAFLIMFMNNVCQAVGQLSVPSGIAALLYGTVPVFMMLGDWQILGGRRPARTQWLAVAGAMLGLGTLLPTSEAELRCTLPGASVILLGVFCFVAGSLYARRFLRSAGLSLYGGMSLSMLFGGIMSLLASLAAGERIDLSGLSPGSLGAMAFLTLFTSVLGYFCYYWLLAHTRTIVAVSFAFIDPVIAVTLGWLFADEPVTPRALLACALIVGAVICALRQEAAHHEAENRSGVRKRSG